MAGVEGDEVVWVLVDMVVVVVVVVLVVVGRGVGGSFSSTVCSARHGHTGLISTMPNRLSYRPIV